MIEAAIDEAVDADPLLFGRATLGRKRWKRQREIRTALESHRRIAVRAANGVGKTFELGSIVCEWMVTQPGARVICAGPSHHAIKRGLWSEVRRAYYECQRKGIDLGGIMGRDSWTIDDGWDASIVSVDNPSAAHGAHGPRVLIVIDEAQGVEDPVLFEAFDSLMTSPGARMILSGNPLWPQGYFFDATQSEDWHTIQIDGFEHPNIRANAEIVGGSITRVWIDEKKKEWGEDDPRYTARVRGEFPEAGDRQLIPIKLLEACAKIVPPVTEARRAGLDVAREGNDRNACVILDEHRVLIHCETWRSPDLSYTQGKFLDICRRFHVPPERASVDVCGIGAGVVDGCRAAGYRVKPVNFGATVGLGGWHSLLGREALHHNLKGELHDAMRQMFRRGLISIPKTLETKPLWVDLTSLQFTFDPSGKFMVRDKDWMRAHTGRSPDCSDALAIALMPDGFTEPTPAEYRAFGARFGR